MGDDLPRAVDLAEHGEPRRTFRNLLSFDHLVDAQRVANDHDIAGMRLDDIFVAEIGCAADLSDAAIDVAVAVLADAVRAHDLVFGREPFRYGLGPAEHAFRETDDRDTRLVKVMSVGQSGGRDKKCSSESGRCERRSDHGGLPYRKLHRRRRITPDAGAALLAAT
ncbi:MAG: hypothetical protein VW547_17905 [Alphaproteobacteria bacterium]